MDEERLREIEAELQDGLDDASSWNTTAYAWAAEHGPALVAEVRRLREANARWEQIAAAEGLLGEDAYHAELRRQEAEETQPDPAP